MRGRRFEEKDDDGTGKKRFDNRPEDIKDGHRRFVLEAEPAAADQETRDVVVEVGAVITGVVLVLEAFRPKGERRFGLQITLWLWFTVLFANFAEAMAEGRGKAQAETLRKARAETEARKLRSDGKTEVIPSSKLRSGDVVLVAAGEFIPGDGEVIEGVASVDESAITGDSAPVIREAGGDARQ